MDDLAEGFGEVGAVFVEGSVIPPNENGDEGGDSGGFEGAFASKELVEGDAEGVDVGSGIEVHALGLFGGHIGGGAGEGAVVCVLGGARGDAEVGKFCAVGHLFDEDVVGFDVSVEDAAAVGKAEGFGAFGTYSDNLCGGEPLTKCFGEGVDVTPDVLKHEIESLFVFAKGVDLDNVGMVKTGEESGFFEEVLA